MSDFRSQPHLPDAFRVIEQRIAALERRLARPTTLLDVQTIAGNHNDYTPAVHGNRVEGDPTAGVKPFLLTYTPPVDAWWRVHCHVGLIQKVDAAYHYGYLYLNLSPADEDGQAKGRQIHTQHASVQTHCSRTPARTFKLQAGVTYEVDARWDLGVAPGSTTRGPSSCGWKRRHGHGEGVKAVTKKDDSPDVKVELEDRATVRELSDFRVAVERRFGRVEKTLMVLVVLNVLPRIPALDSLPTAPEAVAQIVRLLA